MNTPVPKDTGFSDKLCGNPLTWRPTDSSCREFSLEQNDPCSRYIAVDGATAFAAMHPFGERFTFNRSAFWTRLTCVAGIDQSHDRTGTFSLVRNELDELTPCGIVNGLREHAGREPFDIQVLHSDVREAAHQGSRQFMGEVPSLIGDVSRKPCDTEFGLALMFAVSPLPGNRTLSAAKRSGCVLRALRSRHSLPVGQRHQRGQAEVYPNRREVAVDQLPLRQFGLKADVPFTTRTADHGGAYFGIVGNVTVPAHFDFAWNTDDADSLIFTNGQAVADTKIGTVELSIGAKARKARLCATPHASEERRERLIEPAQHLLFGRESVPSQPIVRGPYGLQFGRLVTIPQTDTSPSVGFDSLLQTGVVEVAKGPKHFGQRSFLRARSKQAKLERAVCRRYGLVSHVEEQSRLVRGAVSVLALTVPRFIHQ